MKIWSLTVLSPEGGGCLFDSRVTPEVLRTVRPSRVNNTDRWSLFTTFDWVNDMWCDHGTGNGWRTGRHRQPTHIWSLRWANNNQSVSPHSTGSGENYFRQPAFRQTPRPETSPVLLRRGRKGTAGSRTGSSRTRRRWDVGSIGGRPSQRCPARPAAPSASGGRTAAGGWLAVRGPRLSPRQRFRSSSSL